MKRQPKQIRLEPEMEDEVKKIAEVTGLSQSEIIRQLITAGARALKAHGYKFRVPLQVVVAPEDDARYPERKPEEQRYVVEDGKRGKSSSASEDTLSKLDDLAVTELKKHLAKRKAGSSSGAPPKTEP